MWEQQRIAQYDLGLSWSGKILISTERSSSCVLPEGDHWLVNQDVEVALGCLIKISADDILKFHADILLRRKCT